MKIKVNDEHVFELSDIQKKVIQNEIMFSMFEEDMKRRARYIIEHKYERCMKRLREEWIPKLQANGVKSIPLNDDDFAELVFSQPNYLDAQAKYDQQEQEEEKNE